MLDDAAPQSWSVFLPGRWPLLNQLNNAKAGRYGHHAYHKLKMAWQHPATLLLKAARIPPLESARIRYLHRRADRRADKSNLAAAAMKIIEDAIVDAGILQDDGWNFVIGFTHDFEVGKPEGVAVTIEGAQRAEISPK